MQGEFPFFKSLRRAIKIQADLIGSFHELRHLAAVLRKDVRYLLPAFPAAENHTVNVCRSKAELEVIELRYRFGATGTAVLFLKYRT